MVLKCEQCGASLSPLLLACTFCGTATPAAIAAHQREVEDAHTRAQWAAHAEHQKSVATTARMTALGTQSAIWSAVGLVLCCTPAGIVGLVLGVRSRALAAEVRSSPPASALIGIALGTLASLTSVGAIVRGIVTAPATAMHTTERAVPPAETHGSEHGSEHANEHAAPASPHPPASSHPAPSAKPKGK